MIIWIKTKAVMAQTKIEIAKTISDPKWSKIIEPIDQEINQLVRLVVENSFEHGGDVEVSLVFVDDVMIQDLNKEYRQKDKPTNVLSFPQWDDFDDLDIMPQPILLGDVILARETIRREALAQNKELHHHLLHLIAHGVLHLIGYDHIDEDEAHEMEQIEIAVLSQLNIANPYV